MTPDTKVRPSFGTEPSQSCRRRFSTVRAMRLLDVVLPRRCGVCGRIGASLCDRCRPSLLRCGPPWCERCGAPGPWPVRRCAECSGGGWPSPAPGPPSSTRRTRGRSSPSWKERGRRDLAAVAAEIVAVTLPRPAVDVLSFVPGDRDRELKRGHAPAARSRASSPRSGRFPSRRCSNGGPASTVSATCRGRLGAPTSPVPSLRAAPARPASASSTTSTRPVPPRPRARRRCDGRRAKRVDVACFARAVR